MPTGSTTVLVTVRGPQGATDLELPADVPLRELLPLVVAICGSHASTASPEASSRWGLGRPAGSPFAAEQTLVDHEVMDGATLLLLDETSWGHISLGRLPSSEEEGGPPADEEVALGGIGIRWNRGGLLS